MPSRPGNALLQAYDTMLTIIREITYPRVVPFSGVITRYFSPPSLGSCIVLGAYWVMVLTMLWSNVILAPDSPNIAYKWEVVGFRGAWVSVTQIPLLYCLGGKANIISIITGISYERLNWLHRWIARTIFLTVIVHWSYFFREWWLADFVEFEFQMMPIIKYGFGAWAVLGWTILTGFGFFRSKSYEIWVLQHLASAAVLLWLLYVHVPSYARYNIWMSIGFVAFDRGVRGIWSLACNFHLSAVWSKMPRSSTFCGFSASAYPLPHGYVHMEIEDVDFSWKAGQHIFISIPSCGVFESHPFTIANTSPSDEKQSRTLQLYCKCHSGFTRRLLRKAEAGKTQKFRVFVSGPWGTPPLNTIERCNSLILIGSSTGASFTLPILEHAIKQAPYIQRVCFYWIVRHPEQLGWFEERMITAIKSLKEMSVDVECKIFLTSPPDTMLVMSHSPTAPSIDHNDQNLKALAQATEHQLDAKRSFSSVSQQSDLEKNDLSSEPSSDLSSLKSSSIENPTNEKFLDSNPRLQHDCTIDIFSGRPKSWDSLIRPTLEEAEGETVIIACGGNQMMSEIRNYTAAISDERAVHKGSGAQGIYLFTETFGW